MLTQIPPEALEARVSGVGLVPGRLRDQLDGVPHGFHGSWLRD
jgi:hypothetical protein